MSAPKTELYTCQIFVSDRPTVDVVAQVISLDYDIIHAFVPIELARTDGIMVEVIERREKTSLVAITCNTYLGAFPQDREWNRLCVVSNKQLKQSEGSSYESRL